ncbi:hypothetical protein MVEN_01037900 [Mycena venus]|uniref:Uncharacterized protein n=1 Tax=Mycena venus TaxID=2733690 RepID=A0A8H7D347_9AGAR|nr:hypothetical protein MVEN_01037900 [Mycena venus]
MDFPVTALFPALTTIQIVRNGVLSVYSLSIYEWLETLPTEIELVCAQEMAAGSVDLDTDLPFALEFHKSSIPPLQILSAAAMASCGNHTAQTCSKLTQIVTSLLLPMQLFAPGVMLMRAYAFAGRSARVLVLLLVFYAALVGIDIWFFCFDVDPLPDIAYDILGETGCFPDYAANNGGMRLIIAMSASLVMDLVSLSIIIIYCLRIHSTRGSLGRVFLRQGLSSFAVVLVVHGIAMGLYFSPQSFYNGVGLPYILVISNLMACRLILDLRRKALPTETEIWRQNSLLVNQAFEGTDLWVIEGNTERYPTRPHR